MGRIRKSEKAEIFIWVSDPAHQLKFRKDRVPSYTQILQHTYHRIYCGTIECHLDKRMLVPSHLRPVVVQTLHLRINQYLGNHWNQEEKTN